MVTSCQNSRNNSSIPLVTVVTVTYQLLKNKREHYFCECIHSVHKQTYPAIEHLVIDGGSDDGTVQLLQEYADKGWISYISEPDKGIYDAMNKGLHRAHGKYIAFLNSDDLWHNPKGIETTIHLLETTGADFSYAPSRWVNEKGKLLGNQYPVIGSFFCQMPICHQTMFTRTDIMREMGGFDAEHLKIAADYDFVQRLILARHRSVHVPLNFTTFRYGSGISTISEMARKSIEEVRLLHKRYYVPSISEEESERLWDKIVPYRLIQELTMRTRGIYDDQINAVYVPINHDMVEVIRFPKLIPAEEHETDALSASMDCSALAGYPVQTMGSSASASLAVCSIETASAFSHLYKTSIRGPLGIPIFKIVRRQNKKAGLYLFSFLKLGILKTKQHDVSKKSNRILLFGFLPLWRTVKRTRGTTCTSRHYLFSFIPIGSSTKTTIGM